MYILNKFLDTSMNYFNWVKVIKFDRTYNRTSSFALTFHTYLSPTYSPAQATPPPHFSHYLLRLWRKKLFWTILFLLIYQTPKNIFLNTKNTLNLWLYFLLKKKAILMHETLIFFFFSFSLYYCFQSHDQLGKYILPIIHFEFNLYRLTV